MSGAYAACSTNDAAPRAAPSSAMSDIATLTMWLRRAYGRERRNSLILAL